ncbi:hypothetical protein [Flavobacterium sp.]|jgi:hypothetical protein|uniref:hypothetical protein n=1 Tax=Flavobacterium sp. TaxID=239 RepID=UPI0037C07DF7
MKKIVNNELEEFNSSVDLINVRKLYKDKFDVIEVFIRKYGYGLALTDISNLDLKNKQIIEENESLLKKINRKIYFDKIKFEDIK